MKNTLEIGQRLSGGKFTLPLDLVTRTLAIIAIRGWGKTVAATVIAEEMCEAGLPWVAIDPVGVWWGLRANPDGSAGGYPIVILGGERGDLPLEKSAGAKVAEAILQEDVSCVIDMSSESKTTVRHFVAEFCDRLMDLRPQTPRHIFIEEAPELVPQKPMGEQKRSLAAVDRLIRLGRNRGYGATLISQRTATIQKDVLTQCESLLAGRSIGKPDRDAMQSWIAELVEEPSPTNASKFVQSLANLESGVGWFWSPQWLGSFEQIRVRRRKSYHPGETRSVGQAVKQVKLSNVHEFVERFGTILRGEKTKPRKVEDVNVDFKAAYEEAQQTIRTLTTRIEQLERGSAAKSNSLPHQPSAVKPSPVDVDGEVAMALAVKRPVIDLTKRVYVIEASDDAQFGRIALLLSEGFFDSPKKIEHINREFIVRGWAAGTGRPSPKNLDMGKLAEYGFVLVVGAGTYQAVPGMKVNVKEVQVA
ncbi:MAG: hypothetical protein ACRD20_20655 [Terriglobales bacterium]